MRKAQILLLELSWLFQETVFLIFFLLEADRYIQEAAVNEHSIALLSSYCQRVPGVAGAAEGDFAHPMPRCWAGLVLGRGSHGGDAPKPPVI